MGMSSDYTEAIELNATYIRIGTSLFGKRLPEDLPFRALPPHRGVHAGAPVPPAVKVLISKRKDHLQCQKTAQLFGSASWKSWGVALEVRQTT